MLFGILYDVCLFILSLIALPIVVWQRFRFGKYKNSLAQRLGIRLPSFVKKEGESVIWLHTISMGETRAAIPFFQKLKVEYPNSRIVISSITETGHIEAKRSMPGADSHFYLPVDFSFVMKKMMKKIKPDVVVLLESDFWYQFLKHAKKSGAKTLLINGKLSERSFRRFSKVRFFFIRLFACFDKLCVQSSEYAKRFETLGDDPSKVVVTGNIKLDASFSLLTQEEKIAFRGQMGIAENDLVIALGSSHFPEEEKILEALGNLFSKHPTAKILIVPRHPERFTEVEELLKHKGITYTLFSKRHECVNPLAQVILIDAMGVLIKCYQISDLAIVCGSYTDKVGGHNIFEPILLGVPVFFGPHMFSQRDLRDLVKPSGAGLQVPIENLGIAVDEFFSSKEIRDQYRKNCFILRDEVKGAFARTWNVCSSIMDSVLKKK